MNISFSETFKKVTSVALVFGIVFSMTSPVAFAGPITGISVGAQSGILTSGTAGNANYTVTLSKSGSNSITNTLSITSVLPTGVTASFGTNPITWSSNGTTTTLTLTTTSATPSGTTIFTLQGAAGITTTGSLTIGAAADTTAPVISQVTAVPSPTTDTTPSYTFTTDEAGTITYGGSCSGTDTTAEAGLNTITFNALSDGTYADCTITVTDTATVPNPSTPLSVNSFIIDTTGPSVPTNTLPNGTYVNTDEWDFTWNTSTDNQPGAITYEYQASQNSAVDGLGVLTTDVWTSGSLATNTIHSAGAAEGVWYWQVRAKDALGNYSAWSPVATVTKDTIAPVISTDDSFLTVGTVTGTGAIITYTTVPAATDSGTPSPLVTCSPLSGTNFPLNSTATITCNSTDDAGNTGVQTFDIIIEDEEDPVLVIPGNISIEVVAASSAPVTFTVSATDNVDTFGTPVTSGTAPAIVCNHLSGDTFNFGTTIVTCTATDTEGNDATDDFSVVLQDTIAPTLVISLDDTDLNSGDTSLVTFTFSEAPVDFDNTDVIVENGSIDPITGSGTVYTATLTPTTGIEDTTNNITVGISWSDANTPTGNAPTSTTLSTNYIIDTLAPVISQVTGVPSSTTDTTPDYTFTTSEAGTITYGGDCSSSTTAAAVGSNTVTFNALSTGIHTNCTVTLEDAAGNVSNTLIVSEFTITTPASGGGGGGSVILPPNPTQPTTPENTQPNPEPTTPEVTPTPETPTNETTPVTPTPTTPTTPTGNTTGGTGGTTGGNTPAFNPADATLDIGGAGTAEEEPVVEEVTPAPEVASTDVGGGVAVEDTSYTLLWILLALIALLNVWWFFVAKNKQSVHRRD